MDNKAIAGILYETADLMEINGDDSFRIRSYRNAAEAIEGLPQSVEQLVCEPKKLLQVPGIGKSMAEKLQEICKQGKLSLHTQLLEKYHPSMLELLKIQGLGPKTIALIWSAYKVSDLAGVEKLAREGKLHELPRMGEKQEQKILKAIEDYRRIAGRYCLDEADKIAEKLAAHLAGLPGVEKITPAGSLRRGRETVGDLDILVTGQCCANAEQRDAVIEKIVHFPDIRDVIGQGENKVSFRLRSGMQVDVRLLPPDSFGAAMQYFTGSKSHYVALRLRALKMGYSLSENGLYELPPDADKTGGNGSPAEGKRVAGTTEEEIYTRLKLDYIPPELRENCGEIEAAPELPRPRLAAGVVRKGVGTSTRGKPMGNGPLEKWPEP